MHWSVRTNLACPQQLEMSRLLAGNSVSELSQAGNEAVLRARFQDAQFFFQEDLKRPLAEFRPLLAGTLFQKDLGTLLEKSVMLFFMLCICTVAGAFAV